MHESIYTHTQDYVRQNNEYILQIESLKDHPDRATDVFLADLDFMEIALCQEQYKVPSFDDIEHHIRRIKTAAERLKYCQELYSEINLFAEENHPIKFNSQKDNADLADLHDYHDGLTLLQNRIGLEIAYLSEEQKVLTHDVVFEPVEDIPLATAEVQPSPNPAFIVDELSRKKWLNIPEAAFYLGIAVKTLQNRISNGMIPEDAYRGKRESRIFLRSKLDLYREGKLIDSKLFLKVNWLKNKYTLEAFLEWYTGKFSDLKGDDLLPHFTTGVSESQSILNGIDWKQQGQVTNHKSLVLLASLLVLLHRHAYIDLWYHGPSLKVRPFMTSHFTLNGKRIAEKTATNAIAEIRSDEEDGYSPFWKPFDSLFSKSLTRNEILRRVNAKSAKVK
jgi:hypothetical protein